MTTTTLNFQNPAGDYLLDVLLEQSIGATGGGAAFAWATRRGIYLLLEDEVFTEFLGSAEFQLIVGVDDITTPDALHALSDLETRFPCFNVRIYKSDAAGTLFHPKMTWFRHDAAGSLVVGSGNLTGGGLWDNWEAFTVSVMDDAATTRIQEQWTAWRNANSSRLYKVLDPAVLDRAEENRKRWRRRRPAPKPGEGPAAAEIISVFGAMDVLVAEIPASGDRWQQANFDKENYERFFGAQVGTRRRMLFQSLRDDGSLAEVEKHPSVEVASRNYRFELGAAPRGPYPAQGRPIGVFLRLKDRTFLYLVSMPRDQWHEELQEYLDASPVAESMIRRVRSDSASLKELASVNRLLQASPNAFADEVAD